MKYLDSQPFTARTNTEEFERNYAEALPGGVKPLSCTKRGCVHIGTAKECKDCSVTLDVSDQFPEVP